MHLIRPVFLIDHLPAPSFALRGHAQTLADTFARRLGVPTLRIVFAAEEDDGEHCQSPVGAFAHLDEDGNIALAPSALDDECLEFIVAHQMAHRAQITAEWECDLAALDLMRCPVMPIVAQTALVIAQIPSLRTRAFQFKSGPRIVAIGDALASGVWKDSFVRLPNVQDD